MKTFNILTVGIVIGVIFTLIIFNSSYTYVPEGNETVELTDDEYNHIESLQFDTASFHPQYIEEMGSVVITNGESLYYLIYDDPDANFFSLEILMDEYTYNIVLPLWSNMLKARAENRGKIVWGDRIFHEVNGIKKEIMIVNESGTAYLRMK